MAKQSQSSVSKRKVFMITSNREFLGNLIQKAIRRLFAGKNRQKREFGKIGCDFVYGRCLGVGAEERGQGEAIAKPDGNE